MKINTIKAQKFNPIFKSANSSNPWFEGTNEQYNNETDSFKHSKKQAQIICGTVALTGLLLAHLLLIFHKK